MKRAIRFLCAVAMLGAAGPAAAQLDFDGLGVGFAAGGEGVTRRLGVGVGLP